MKRPKQMKDNGEKRSKWNIQTVGHNYEWHTKERFVKDAPGFTLSWVVFDKRNHFNPQQSVTFTPDAWINQNIKI